MEEPARRYYLSILLVIGFALIGWFLVVADVSTNVATVLREKETKSFQIAPTVTTPHNILPKVKPQGTPASTDDFFLPGD
jgi:hypothetical protein